MPNQQCQSTEDKDRAQLTVDQELRASKGVTIDWITTLTYE